MNECIICYNTRKTPKLCDYDHHICETCYFRLKSINCPVCKLKMKPYRLIHKIKLLRSNITKNS